MAAKRFQSSLFGFDKGSVNIYVENLTRDYEEKLTSKDMEIEKTMDHLKKVNKKYEELKLEEERIYTEKEKISKALVSANEKAEKIIAEAKERVAAEVIELEAVAEKEREKIVDIKKELKSMKVEAIAILENYGKSIDAILLDEEPVAAPDENENIEENENVNGDDFFG